ncbi:hypothetical protein BDW59DRAFT_141563 [Aspergillus cavernicola]|uniref:Uncharacterized protein n=1 Tax=Aspergillus cavernicola TaxID=176166 RepID=A0ABR4IRU7_9EURO
MVSHGWRFCGVACWRGYFLATLGFKEDGSLHPVKKLYFHIPCGTGMHSLIVNAEGYLAVKLVTWEQRVWKSRYRLTVH